MSLHSPFDFLDVIYRVRVLCALFSGNAAACEPRRGVTVMYSRLEIGENNIVAARAGGMVFARDAYNRADGDAKPRVSRLAGKS